MNQTPVANPSVNPMQVPYGYPANPGMMFNNQFASQANTMMGGTMYQQPQAQYAPQGQPAYTPQYAPVQPQQGQQPQAQPDASKDQPKTDSADFKVNL